jgi:hypothetical protein
VAVVSSERRPTEIQLSAGFAKILFERQDGSRLLARVTRNFSGDCPETKALSVGAVLSSPVIERDAIYLGSTDDNLCAIG